MIRVIKSDNIDEEAGSGGMKRNTNTSYVIGDVATLFVGTIHIGKCGVCMSSIYLPLVSV